MVEDNLLDNSKPESCAIRFSESHKGLENIVTNLLGNP